MPTEDVNELRRYGNTSRLITPRRSNGRPPSSGASPRIIEVDDNGPGAVDFYHPPSATSNNREVGPTPCVQPQYRSYFVWGTSLTFLLFLSLLALTWLPTIYVSKSVYQPFVEPIPYPLNADANVDRHIQELIATESRDMEKYWAIHQKRASLIEMVKSTNQELLHRLPCALKNSARFDSRNRKARIGLPDDIKLLDMQIDQLVSEASILRSQYDSIEAASDRYLTSLTKTLEDRHQNAVLAFLIMFQPELGEYIGANFTKWIRDPWAKQNERLSQGRVAMIGLRKVLDRFNSTQQTAERIQCHLKQLLAIWGNEGAVVPCDGKVTSFNTENSRLVLEGGTAKDEELRLWFWQGVGQYVIPGRVVPVERRDDEWWAKLDKSCDSPRSNSV